MSAFDLTGCFFLVCGCMCARAYGHVNLYTGVSWLDTSAWQVCVTCTFGNMTTLSSASPRFDADVV